MTAEPIHPCALCGCEGGDLSDHCEDHLEMARAVGKSNPCGPCPRFPDQFGPDGAHRLEDDYDGTRFCSACAMAGLDEADAA